MLVLVNDGVDDIAEGQQAAVDVDGLLQPRTLSLGSRAGHAGSRQGIRQQGRHSRSGGGGGIQVDGGSWWGPGHKRGHTQGRQAYAGTIMCAHQHCCSRQKWSAAPGM